MKVNMTAEQYAVVKRMFACASKDETRGALVCVHYDVKKKRLEATDGRVLRLEPFDLFGVTKDILFDEDDCILSISQANRLRTVSLDVRDKDFDYPDVDKAIPDDKRNGGDRAIRLSPENITKFIKSLGKEEHLYLVMVPTYALGLTKIFTHKSGITRLLGGVMPMRVHDTHDCDWVMDLFPKPEEENAEGKDENAEGKDEK